MSHTTPPWPSLYNPGLEILHIEHRPAVQPGGAYLYSATDIFRFTFYWTLIFYTPIFFVCGFYAFCNYTIPPQRPPSKALSRSSEESSEQEHSVDYEEATRTNNVGVYVPLRLLQSRRSPLTPRATPTSRSAVLTPRKNEGRSRLTFALLVFLVFLALGLAGAVIGSAILGFATMGLYHAGKFNMSTWIPFLLAVIQVFVGLLSVWPSVIEII